MKVSTDKPALSGKCRVQLPGEWVWTTAEDGTIFASCYLNPEDEERARRDAQARAVMCQVARQEFDREASHAA